MQEESIRVRGTWDMSLQNGRLIIPKGNESVHPDKQIPYVLYYVKYTVHKLHMDQNEKLIDLGVNKVFASDSYRDKICWLSCDAYQEQPWDLYDEV